MKIRLLWSKLVTSLPICCHNSKECIVEEAAQFSNLLKQCRIVTSVIVILGYTPESTRLVVSELRPSMRHLYVDSLYNRVHDYMWIMVWPDRRLSGGWGFTWLLPSCLSFPTIHEMITGNWSDQRNGPYMPYIYILSVQTFDENFQERNPFLSFHWWLTWYAITWCLLVKSCIYEKQAAAERSLWIFARNGCYANKPPLIYLAYHL